MTWSNKESRREKAALVGAIWEVIECGEKGCDESGERHHADMYSTTWNIQMDRCEGAVLLLGE